MTGNKFVQSMYALIEICSLTRKIMKLNVQTVISLKQNIDVRFYYQSTFQMSFRGSFFILCVLDTEANPMKK